MGMWWTWDLAGPPQPRYGNGQSGTWVGGGWWFRMMAVEIVLVGSGVGGMLQETGLAG